MRTLAMTLLVSTMAAAAEVRIRIAVHHEGYYRVTQPELVAAGLDPTVDPRKLSLFVDGAEQAMRVLGEADGRLDPADAVEFYGTGIDSPFSDRHIYWLSISDPPGLRIAERTNDGSGAAITSFSHRVERRVRSWYFAGLLNGEASNFFEAPTGKWPLDEPIDISHLDDKSGASLQVILQGVTTAQHHLLVSLNGLAIAEMHFAGQAQSTLDVALTAGKLQEGTNLVTLTPLEDSKAIHAAVERIRIGYSHTLAVDGAVQPLGAPGGAQVALHGFSSDAIHVLDVTDPKAHTELAAQILAEGKSFAATVQPGGTGMRRLFAYQGKAVSHPLEVRAVHSSDWLHTGRAELVIITHRDFYTAAEALANLRRGQGWQVALIDVDEIFNELNGGQRDPLAIKQLLETAWKSWAVRPRFALLIGDASVDPRNFLGKGSFDFVPTQLLDARSSGVAMETASDDWFGDFDGDGLAEVMVGRLPVRTATEAEHVLQKIIGYGWAGDDDSWRKRALFIADEKLGYDFEDQAHRAEKRLPAGFEALEVFAGQQGKLQREAIVAAINQGALLVNYSGHGAQGQWSDFFKNADIMGLTNGARLPVFFNMTCLNGMFHDALFGDVLAEALLKAPSGGAVAVIASSMLLDAGPQDQLNQGLVEQFGKASLGEVLRYGKSTTTDGDTRNTYLLFGDPSLFGQPLAPQPQPDMGSPMPDGGMGGMMGGCGVGLHRPAAAGGLAIAGLLLLALCRRMLLF